MLGRHPTSARYVRIDTARRQVQKLARSVAAVRLATLRIPGRQHSAVTIHATAYCQVLETVPKEHQN